MPQTIPSRLQDIYHSNDHIRHNLAETIQKLKTLSESPRSSAISHHIKTINDDLIGTLDSINKQQLDIRDTLTPLLKLASILNGNG